MDVLNFAARLVYTGDSIAVVVQLHPPAGVPFLVEAIVDTGAAISVFDKALASVLGIDDVTAGSLLPLRAADDTAAEGYMFPVNLTVLGRSFRAPVVFVPGWPEGIANLLGLTGFLDQLGPVAIDHRNRVFYYG